jgi:hypothetical protein
MAALGTAAPIGSLFSCTYLSVRNRILGLERLILIAQAASGISFIFFSASKQLWLSLLMLVLIEGFGILQITGSNTVIQALVADDKRGRT